MNEKVMRHTIIVCIFCILFGNIGCNTFTTKAISDSVRLSDSLEESSERLKDAYEDIGIGLDDIGEGLSGIRESAEFIEESIDDIAETSERTTIILENSAMVATIQCERVENTDNYDCSFVVSVSDLQVLKE